MIVSERDPNRFSMRRAASGSSTAFRWLLRNCGGYPKFLDTTLVLPIEEHFPDRGMNGHAAVAALFRRVRDHAGMADWPCMVEPETEEPRALRPTPTAFRVITYRRGELEPMSLIAAFAHAISRVTWSKPSRSRRRAVTPAAEPAIELAAVFMGFGVFMANSPREGQHYELNEGEFVHALAMFCLLRKLRPRASIRTSIRTCANTCGSRRAISRSTKCSFRSCAPRAGRPDRSRRQAAKARELIKLPWP